MAAQELSPLVVVGSVASSATTGALVAMGHRAGSARLPFAAMGGLLLPRAPMSQAAELIVAGVVVHVAAIFAWSACCMWLAERRRRRWPVLAVMIVGAGQFLLSWIVARSTGRGLAVLLPLGDRIELAVILAASLVVGMRFAFSPRELHGRTPQERAHQL